MSAPLDAAAAAHRALYDAVESGDADLMESLWLDDDATMCVHPTTLPLRGVSEVVRSWVVLMAHFDYIQFFLTDVAVHALPPDDPDPRTVVVTCTENMLTGGDGATGDEPDLRFGAGTVFSTTILVRGTAGWRLWQRHASPVAIPTTGTD